MDIKKLKKQKTIQELLEFGIINIDKPSGPTSFRVDEIIKKKLKLRKTSHAGTLDPKVTGVLPILLNRACKLLGYFLGHDKTYIGIMKLHKEVSDEKLEKEIKKFSGKIMQKPPVKSRVKRKEREREIKKFEILERENRDVLFLAEVEAGTYIRKLCDDLGKEIGGAHMLELRRIKASIFEEQESYNMYEFEEAVEEYEQGNEDKLRKMLIPAEIISEIIKPIEIKEKNIKKIFTGKPIYVNDLINKEKMKKNNLISVFCNNKFVGIYEVVNEKEIFAKSKFVLQAIKG